MNKDENNHTTDRKEIDIPNFINNGTTKDKASKNLFYDADEFADSDFLNEVNTSLARQVSSELADKQQPKSNSTRKKKRSSRLLKVLFFSLLSLTALCCLLLFTKGGKKIVINMAGDYIYNKLDYQASDTTKNNNSKDTVTTADNKEKEVSHIVNILLIGVEEFENARNTDTMMVATMNTKDNSLKLTSLMRDLYVQIPGYKDNKLNSAYSKGGIELLYETIELNFDIHLDGYCLVNFDAFEKIVDMVGGVEITLTSKEANYLNTTNYISNREERNVVEGKQTMSGNQALGYCRVRRVSTGTENNDYGRTQRQRIVLEAIYNKLKKKNIIELALLMKDILTKIPIETDIKEADFKNYLEEAVDLKVKEIDTYRVPSDGSFESVDVQLGKYMQDVLQPLDWDATRKEIRAFIYGDLAKTN